MNSPSPLTQFYSYNKKYERGMTFTIKTETSFTDIILNSDDFNIEQP